MFQSCFYNSFSPFNLNVPWDYWDWIFYGAVTPTYFGTTQNLLYFDWCSEFL